ncbi:MAG: cupin domain-containing protein, partial [Desulfovibrio sp.]|nr:cupin domain-containing protein [Desulfovibrio sp.]
GRHTHKGDFEVYYVLKGEAAYDDNGTMTTLKAGDVAVCQDGESHSVLNEGSGDFEFIALVLFTK